MATQIVPLTPNMNQNFKITLSVDGKNITLNLAFVYNTPGGYWFMSISDNIGNMLLDAIPLVTGNYPTADILGQYTYLGLGSAMIVPIGSVQGIPNETNLGTDFVLAWSDTVS